MFNSDWTQTSDLPNFESRNALFNGPIGPSCAGSFYPARGAGHDPPGKTHIKPERNAVQRMIFKKSKLSILLIAIHTHAEIANEENTDQIVYREKDIIELLKKLKEDENILKDGLRA